MPDYKEGHIVRNKKTGEARILRNNEWVPYTENPAWVDALKSVPGGLVKGATGLATTPFTVADLSARMIDWAAQKGLSPENAAKVHNEAEALKQYVAPYTYEGAMDTINKHFGPFHEPTTTAGRITQGVGEYAPLLFGGEGSLATKLGTKLATKLGKPLLRAGVASGTAEGASQAAQAMGVDPKYDPLVRAIAGAGSYGVPSILRKAVTPNPLTGPEGALRQQHLDILRGYKDPSGKQLIDIPASQAVNSPRIAAWEGRGGQPPPGQAQQVTQAMLGEAGIDAPLATKDVMTQANIGLRKNQPQYHATQALGPGTATGILDPAAVSAATAKATKNRAAIPSSKLSKLADAATNVTQPIIPHTPQGWVAPLVGGTLGVGTGLGRALSSGEGVLSGLVKGSEQGVFGLLSAPYAQQAVRGAVGAAARSKPGQAYLANQLWKPGTLTGMTPAQAAAILSSPNVGLPSAIPKITVNPRHYDETDPTLAPPISR